MRLLPMFIPIRASRKCERCGLRYSDQLERCPHCSGLSETELQQLKLRIATSQRRMASLGKSMLILALVLLLGIVGLAVSHNN